MNARDVLVRVLGILGLTLPALLAIWVAWMLAGTWLSRTAKPSIPAGQKSFLCRAAAACKKYSEVRLECATAGNFKTCLRIKMGDDASFSEMCSGYDEGAPAVPLPPETPNAVNCFFRNLLNH
jgi:hypothetical protein